ncbi:MAG: hypothetical protein AAFX44_06070 [Pseudomonadota bacterium]
MYRILLDVDGLNRKMAGRLADSMSFDYSDYQNVDGKPEFSYGEEQRFITARIDGISLYIMFGAHHGRVLIEQIGARELNDEMEAVAGKVENALRRLSLKWRRTERAEKLDPFV